jgi:hypothetical protein
MLPAGDIFLVAMNISVASITKINCSLFKLVESINLQSTGSGSTFWFAVRSWILYAVSCCSDCGYKIEYTKTMQMQLALTLAGLRLRLIAHWHCDCVLLILIAYILVSYIE